MNKPTLVAVMVITVLQGVGRRLEDSRSPEPCGQRRRTWTGPNLAVGLDARFPIPDLDCTVEVDAIKLVKVIEKQRLGRILSTDDNKKASETPMSRGVRVNVRFHHEFDPANCAWSPTKRSTKNRRQMLREIQPKVRRNVRTKVREDKLESQITPRGTAPCRTRPDHGRGKSGRRKAHAEGTDGAKRNIKVAAVVTGAEVDGVAPDSPKFTKANDGLANKPLDEQAWLRVRRTWCAGSGAPRLASPG